MVTSKAIPKSSQILSLEDWLENPPLVLNGWMEN
jgi:hypothetical protein